MSISSSDSLFEDDENVLVEEKEEIDYYAVLNVPRDASSEDINKAYKARCLLFHPDRHTDPKAQKDAEKVFVVVRKAHETLSDPEKRAIYDAVGLRGLEMQGWQLVSKSNNAENIRKEYEFLKKLRDTEVMIQRSHPTGAFNVKINAAGLFCEEEEDRFPPYLVGLSINQAVDTALTPKDRFGLVGRVKSVNGRGDGSFGASWKRSLNASLHFETNATVGPDSVSGLAKLSKSISPKVMVQLAPTAQFMPSTGIYDLSLASTLSMFLSPSWQGSLSLSYGLKSSYISTTLMKTELNHPKFTLNLTLSPANSFIRTTYHKRYTDDDGHMEMNVTLSPFGVIPSVLYERRISRYSKVACGITVSYPNCALIGKFRLKTSLNHYELNVVLCESQDELARSVIYGVAFPYITYHTARIVFRKAFSRFGRLFDDSDLEQQVDEGKREDSQRVINLMRPTADRIQKIEEQKHGLVILEAKYGQMEGENPQYPIPGERVIDVTVPLQAMVNDSQLRIFAVKSQLTGFYDPCPSEMKMLKVVYRFRDQLHAVVVPDELPLNIPLASHRVSQ
ncbi:unnamed protein product [Bursaphelenchus xylophilus]|uniref:(pine wood nematode) hypothetical protein n=1 Tax=Bursaphelenchus xylophilus TaxID=6326 RepID=A0A1I7SVW2_BURXY|nr:unnamed protein product [Bursaphelenchus xylophilus]CAG9098383.1 unnamed protein product [Bursaphelenchus xylophilus]